MNYYPTSSRAVGSSLGAFRWLTVSLFAGLALHAQTSPANPTVSSSGKSEDVVTLKEFNVTGADDGSYVASESTTGSRVNTKIKDLPYTVNVLTSEFFRDFSIFEATDELSYMSGVSGVD